MTPEDRGPAWFQRLENGLLAVLAGVAFVELGHRWWWLLALFLVFDLSMVGYAVDPRVGAWAYNAVHNFAPPAALGIYGVAADARWATFVGLLWAFHVAVDRLLGYGLKFTDRFTHTHLGDIGGGRERASTPDRSMPDSRP